MAESVPSVPSVPSAPAVPSDETSVLGGRVVRRRLPVIVGRPGPDAPAVKRLRLPQGELAQIWNGEEPIHYLAWIELGLGGIRGNHVHRRKRERIYLVAGKVRLRLEDPETRERAELILEAGDLVRITPGIAHSLESLEPGHGIEFAPDPLEAADSFPYQLGTTKPG